MLAVSVQDATASGEVAGSGRAWRIGQELPVFVSKPIARGTLEEPAQELQRRKGELADAMLQEDAELAPAIDATSCRRFSVALRQGDIEEIIFTLRALANGNALNVEAR